AGFGGPDFPGAVEVYDVPTRRPTWIALERRGVASVALSHDNTRLAWGNWSGLTTFRDFSTHHDVSRLGPNGRNVRSAYSRDGKWLATASEARLLRLFDIRTGAPTCSFRGDLHDLFCLGFSPDSRLLAAGGGGLTPGLSNHVTVWDVGTHRQVAKLEGHA